MPSSGDKRPYKERILQALSNEDKKKAESIAHEAFQDKNADESILSWISAASFEKNFRSSPNLLQQFVKKYPNSFHLPRIYLADLHALNGRYDIASDEARAYLRQCKDAGILTNLESNWIISEGVSRAFLLLTGVYTELGARSYSKRVLKFALHHSLTKEWIDQYNEELKRLDTEMQNPANRKLDNQWEAFFSKGGNAKILYDFCISMKSPILAKRVDLLESNFRYNSKFSIDENEILTLVMTNDSNLSMLQ